MNRKRVSIKDVAELAGVSYQTVSKVLNGQAHVSAEKIERILASARELGYKPNRQARNLRAQRSHLIGYSWESGTLDVANFILDKFLTSMVEEAEAAGYHLLPFPYREGEDQIQGYRDLIEAGQVDGFVISSVNYNDPRAAYLLSQSFPFVAFGRSNANHDFPWVDVDGTAGVRLAVEHLLARGHRRIAALAWPETSRVGNERLSGYTAALAAAGLTPDPAWIVRAQGTYELARANTERLLDLHPERRPTAIITMNDVMAIGAIQAAQARGLTVGSDLAVIGFDDVPVAPYLMPPLTTIRQPIAEIGRKIVEMLVKIIRGETLAERQVLFRPQLIVRASG